MIVGLVGFIGSGKGSVGDILSNGCGYIQDSFARPLKDAVSAIFGWDREMLEGHTPESRAWREQPCEFWSKQFGYPFTPRMALQLMGTEAGRNVFHNDLWVVSLLHRNIGKQVVVTDVRFKNEVNAIHNYGGLVIRIRRGLEPLWYKTALLANWGDEAAKEKMIQSGVHQSEYDWIGAPIDVVIENDGNLEDLREKVMGFLLTTPLK